MPRRFDDIGLAGTARESGLRILAPDYDMTDPGKEIGRITS